MIGINYMDFCVKLVVPQGRRKMINGKGATKIGES